MIREALIEDIEIINKLGTNIVSNFLMTYNLKDYIENDNYIVLVHCSSSIVDAFLIVLKTLDSYEIELIYVDEEVRRQGIASSLIDYLLSNYVKKGDILLLEVAQNNENAINLYKKYKFDIISTRKKYYQNTDAYVMKKVV